MFNIFSLKTQVARLMAPVEDDAGAAGGGAEVVDRGDSLMAGAPELAADAAAAADAEAEAERIRAEAADAELPLDGETEEQTAARVAAVVDKAKGKPAMIPVERHKAMLDKAREERDSLAAQLANQAKGAAVQVTNERITAMEESITTKEDEYNQALVDGEVAKATALMREIRGIERNMGDLKADMSAQVAESRAVERVRYETTVERLEAAYPMLNPDNEAFDKDQVAEVMDLQSAYVLKGLGAAAALQKAVKLIMGAETAKQEAAATTVARVTAEQTAAALAEAKRKETSTKTAIDAANRTPANAAKVGVDSDKLGGGKMTADQVMALDQSKFAKLDEQTLADLRGDTI